MTNIGRIYKLVLEERGKNDALFVALRLFGLDTPEARELAYGKTADDGGPGSGNWGHKGRPGLVGGSGKGGGNENINAGKQAERMNNLTNNRAVHALPDSQVLKKALQTGGIVRLTPPVTTPQVESAIPEHKPLPEPKTPEEFVKFKQDMKEHPEAYYAPETLSGSKRGKPMTFEEADEMKANPHLLEDAAYWINCQTCVVANELRRRGYNVEATLNNGKRDSANYQLGEDTTLAWIDPLTGVHPRKISVKSTSEDECISKLENTINPGERYVFEFNWKTHNGHIICAEKDSVGNLRLYDPQSGTIIDNRASIVKYLTEIDVKGYDRGLTRQTGISTNPAIYRVDNCLPYLPMTDRVIVPSGKTKRYHPNTALKGYEK